MWKRHTDRVRWEFGWSVACTGVTVGPGGAGQAITPRISGLKGGEGGEGRRRRERESGCCVRRQGDEEMGWDDEKGKPMVAGWQPSIGARLLVARDGEGGAARHKRPGSR